MKAFRPANPNAESEAKDEMISSVQIEGYRGLERFEMDDLGRINLLVGTNNSGKTSVLEAIYLLFSAGNPVALWQLLWRRGERLPPVLFASGDRPPRRSPIELDISHLFTGHDGQPGSRIRIAGSNQGTNRILEYSVREVSPSDQAEIFSADEDGGLTSRLVLDMDGVPKPLLGSVLLSSAGGLSTEALDNSVRRSRQRGGEASPAYFVTAESLSGEELIANWSKIALTPQENLVLQALQFLDPDIERIAAQATGGAYSSSQSRGGFIVKLRGQVQPVPIGSMGDGMWRMLAMAIAITQCEGGVLLVDEIDTGLHYSVMAQMWSLIHRAASTLNVQVFATTHSYDCIYSLAQICSDSKIQRSVSVQRVEAGKSRAIPYDESEIAAATSRDIEVR